MTVDAQEKLVRWGPQGQKEFSVAWRWVYDDARLGQGHHERVDLGIEPIRYVPWVSKLKCPMRFRAHDHDYAAWQKQMQSVYDLLSKVALEGDDVKLMGSSSLMELMTNCVIEWRNCCSLYHKIRFVPELLAEWNRLVPTTPCPTWTYHHEDFLMTVPCP